MKRTLTLLLLLGLSLTAHGWWRSKPAEESTGLIIPAQPGAKKSEEKAPPPTTTKEIKIYCPEPYKLSKKGLFWGAPAGWRSYAQSFVNEIDSFIGAEWIGVNVGKMMCVYSGKKTYTFPVVLQNDQLVPVPKGGNWEVYKGGKVDCHTTEIKDCEFKYTKEETDIKRVYEELEFFEDAPNSQEP